MSIIRGKCLLRSDDMCNGCLLVCLLDGYSLSTPLRSASIRSFIFVSQNTLKQTREWNAHEQYGCHQARENIDYLKGNAMSK